jgi:hypothetical protein
MHRIPASTDTTATYTDIAPLMTAGTLIDSATIDDTVHAPHTYRFVFSGAALAQLDIPPGDSGVLALAYAISGATTTGLRIGGGGSGLSPSFQTYVTVAIADTTPAIKFQQIPRPPNLSRYVSSVVTPIDPDLLTVGTVNGARALIRFPFPEYLKDSALISRATLELTPADTIRGLPGDSAKVEARGIITDFGPKSPTTGVSGHRLMTFNSKDTVRIEVGGEVKNWQLRTLPHPPAFILGLNPEGASFTEPRFNSTRSAGGHPRLHVTYQLPFAFERP